MVIKHDTASTFVFCRFVDGWRLALVEHPRLGLRMVAGGHVESYENHHEAALREATEETGLAGLHFVPAPAPSLPDGYPHQVVEREWWKTEFLVPADNHVGEAHFHVDHQYVAVVDSPRPDHQPAHPVGWFAGSALAALAMPEDTRLLARHLFGRIADLADGRLDDAQKLRPFAAAGG
jgi:8-oxo-dGTP pyrophosphatase MutT (NUDIX family)